MKKKILCNELNAEMARRKCNDLSQVDGESKRCGEPLRGEEWCEVDEKQQFLKKQFRRKYFPVKESGYPGVMKIYGESNDEAQGGGRGLQRLTHAVNFFLILR